MVFSTIAFLIMGKEKGKKVQNILKEKTVHLLSVKKKMPGQYYNPPNDTFLERTHPDLFFDPFLYSKEHAGTEVIKTQSLVMVH